MILTILLGGLLAFAGGLLMGAAVLRRFINRDAERGWPDPAPVTGSNRLLLVLGTLFFVAGLFFCSVPIGFVLFFAE